MEEKFALKYVVGGDLFKRVDVIKRLGVLVCREKVYQNFEPEQYLYQVHDLGQNPEGLISKSDTKEGQCLNTYKSRLMITVGSERIPIVILNTFRIWFS